MKEGPREKAEKGKSTSIQERKKIRANNAENKHKKIMKEEKIEGTKNRENFAIMTGNISEIQSEGNSSLDIAQSHLMNEFEDPWSHMSAKRPRTSSVPQSMDVVVNDNMPDRPSTGLAKTPLVTTQDLSNNFLNPPILTFHPNKFPKHKSRTERNKEKEATKTTDGYFSTSKRPNNIFSLGYSLIRPVSQQKLNKQVNEQKNEEITFKELNDLLVLKEHKNKLRREMIRLEPEIARQVAALKRIKLKPTITPSQQPDTADTERINLRICPKLSPYFQRNLNNENIRKYFTLRNKGCSQHNAIIQANKYIEVPELKNNKRIVKEGLNLGITSKAFIRELKDRGLKECFEKYCENSTFDRKNIIAFYKRAKDNLLPNGVSTNCQKVRKSQSQPNLLTDLQPKDKYKEIYPKAEEVKINVPKELLPSKDKFKRKSKKDPARPKSIPVSSKSSEFPALIQIKKNENKREFDTDQANIIKNIKMNEKEFLMEKINKAQIRKDEYLLRKSQKLKIDHNIVLDKMRRKEEKEYKVKNKKYLQKHFPERLQIFTIKPSEYFNS